MRKIMNKEVLSASDAGFGCGFIANVENFKRRRVLQSFWSLDMSSKMFFKRVLHVKREGEMIFITKTQSKNR